MSFSTLFIGKTGLDAAQRALTVMSHNVANVNTPGFSRQEVLMQSAKPVLMYGSSGAAQQIGRGVSIVSVQRYRDEFLDRQYRARSSDAGFESTSQTILEQVQRLLGEPSDVGIRSDLDAFFNAWSALANRSGDPDARIQVRERAEGLLVRATDMFNGFKDLRTSVNTTIETKVAEINNLAQQVAELNQSILRAQSNGEGPNDLMDHRDKALDQLAKLTGATFGHMANGQVIVSVSGHQLVVGTLVNQIELDRVQETDNPKQIMTHLKWSLDGTGVRFPGGELGALVALRDSVVPQMMGYMDFMFKSLADNINEVHRTGRGLDGSTGIDFFVIGSEWMDVAVNPDLIDPAKIAAASAGAGVPGSGDGATALLLAALRDDASLTDIAAFVPGTVPPVPLVGSRAVTVSGYWQALNGLAGVLTQNAIRRSEAVELQLDLAENHRQSVMGVSLDDEMTKMIQYQHAYTAAARVITVADEMMELLVTRLGIVGR